MKSLYPARHRSRLREYKRVCLPLRLCAGRVRRVLRCAIRLGAMQDQRQLLSHTDWVSALAWHPSSPHALASASYDGSVKLWDLRAAIPLHTLSGHSDSKVTERGWHTTSGTVSMCSVPLMMPLVMQRLHLHQPWRPAGRKSLIHSFRCSASPGPGLGSCCPGAPTAGCSRTRSWCSRGWM